MFTKCKIIAQCACTRFVKTKVRT